MELQPLVKRSESGFRIALGSSVGLHQNIVDASERLHVGGSVPQSCGSLLFLTRILPHDGGATFGRDDQSRSSFQA